MTTTDTPVDNGVNVEALLGAREALTATPEAASFHWRATCDWQNGTHSNSVVEGFFGLGEEQRHRTKFRSTPIIPRSSRRKTTARRRSSMYSWVSPVA